MLIRPKKFLKFNSCKVFQGDLWGIKNRWRKNKYKNKNKKKGYIYKLNKRTFYIQMLAINLFTAFYNPQIPYKKYKNRLHYKNTTFNRFFYSLECRLDTLVYRSCLADTLQHAKFLIKANKLTVNQLTINIYSYKVSPFDLVCIDKKYQLTMQKHFIARYMKKLYKFTIPTYLEIDFQLFSFYLIKLPLLSEVNFPTVLPLKLFRYKLLYK